MEKKDYFDAYISNELREELRKSREYNAFMVKRWDRKFRIQEESWERKFHNQEQENKALQRKVNALVGEREKMKVAFQTEIGDDYRILLAQTRAAEEASAHKDGQIGVLRKLNVGLMKKTKQQGMQIAELEEMTDTQARMIANAALAIEALKERLAEKREKNREV